MLSRGQRGRQGYAEVMAHSAERYGAGSVLPRQWNRAAGGASEKVIRRVHE